MHAASQVATNTILCNRQTTPERYISAPLSASVTQLRSPHVTMVSNMIISRFVICPSQCQHLLHCHSGLQWQCYYSVLDDVAAEMLLYYFCCNLFKKNEIFE
jgi:hypothetical protein